MEMKLIDIDSNGNIVVKDGNGNTIQLTDGGSINGEADGLSAPVVVRDELASDFTLLSTDTTFTDTGLSVDLNLTAGQIVEIEAYGQANAVSSSDDLNFKMRLHDGSTTIRENEHEDSGTTQYRTPARIKFSGTVGTDISAGTPTITLEADNEQGTDITFTAGFVLIAKVYG